VGDPWEDDQEGDSRQESQRRSDGEWGADQEGAFRALSIDEASGNLVIVPSGD